MQKHYNISVYKTHIPTEFPLGVGVAFTPASVKTLSKSLFRLLASVASVIILTGRPSLPIKYIEGTGVSLSNLFY